MTKDDIIADLAMALKEALIWSCVEHVPGPPYKVPYIIQGDLWAWRTAKNKAEAYAIIKHAVGNAAKLTESPTQT